MPDVVYWFFALPDPLPVPHGTTIPFTYQRHMVDALRLLHEDGRCADEDHNLPIEEMLVSLRFWQRRTRWHDPFELDSTLSVARAAFPPEGMEIPENRAGLERDLTIVEAAVILEEGRDHDEESTSQAFDRVLDCVRRVQRAYAVVTKRPVKLATRETLPPMIPTAWRRAGEADDGWPREVSLYLVNLHSVVGHVAEPELTPGQMDALDLAIQRDRSAFMTYVDLRRQAGLALYRLGDYRGAVLAAATAAEVFLDDLLLHLLWEERTRPENACDIFANERAGVLARVRTRYSGRLGGLWSVKDPGPVRDWAEKIAELRNRVVHGGHSPGLKEASASLNALTGLETFVVGLLCDPTVSSRYPRSAIVLAGGTLVERDLMTRRMRALSEDPGEPDWVETFSRWRTSTWRLAGERAGEQVPPAAHDAALIAVLHVDDRLDWVLHDYKAGKAARTAEAWARLPGGQREATRRLLGELTAGARDEAVSIASLPITGLAPVEDWVEQHRRLPGCGVMVDRSDFY
ncbi:hypothetical protein ABGB17_08455 [Sphaerisporangium sp. B11E5]|uniref:hypothetical protein n=1 Tax=Sphaerisporangium sp. B11E5 TaxID=3153563 RepID=UPI00325C48F5